MALKFSIKPTDPDDILYSQAGRPTLDLRFASSKSLVDHVSGQNLIDFTRGGNGVGTYVGADGLIKNSVINLLLRSEEYDNASWTKSRTSISANAGAAPDGSITADKLVEDTSVSLTHLASQDVTVTANTTYSFSVYAKAVERSRLRIDFSDASNGADSVFGLFNLSTGTVASSGAGGNGTLSSTSIQSAGDGWYRCIVVGKFNNTDTDGRVLLYLDNGTTITYTGDGASGLFIWGAQLEQASTVGEYVKTTSSLSGAPRFDHTPVTGESLGLLVEEARTNFLLRSEEFNDASWSKNNGTISSNLSSAPNGLNTADAFIPDAITGLTYLQQQPAPLSAGSVYTFSIFLKASGYSWVFLDAFDGTNNRTWFDLSNGTIGTVTAGNTSTITSYGNGWYRCTLTRTAALTTVNYAIAVVTGNNFQNITANGTSGILLWGAQVEAGAFATSYIPTASLAVTRNEDVVSIVGANFRRWYRQAEGAFYAEACPLLEASVSSIILSASNGTSTDRHTITRNLTSSNARIFSNVAGVIQVQSDLGVWTGKGRIAYGYAADNFAGSLNGASPAVDTAGSVPIVSDLYIGRRSDATTNMINGTVSRIAYFDRRLPNATLQAITSSTPPATYGNLVLNNANDPAAIAGVQPTLDYRFARDRREIESVSLTDKLTYTGDNGTFVGSDGTIQRATTNVPRFDHDPVSRLSKGLLVEVSRENLITWSEQADNAAWLKVRCSITPNAATAPDGLLTADKLVEDTSNNTHRLYASNATITAGATVTFSTFFKPAERSQINLFVDEVGGASFSAYASASGISGSGFTGTGSYLSGSVTPYPNGWYRASITGSLGGVITAIRESVFTAITNNTSYQGDGSSGLFLWGAQLESGTSFTTYIPTSSTAITRTADSAVINGTGVITGTYTMIEKPTGCALVSGSNINLQAGYTAERVMVFPAALSAQQITDIRNAM
jgi:hypothetical protein